MPQFIEHRGVRTALEISGSGPPLLMIHGAEGSRRQFATVAPQLADRFTVIAYDQRDCGDTVNPETVATLADLAEDARALLEALGHSWAFVFGASFGGRVAQALAMRSPSLVRRLVLASTWPLPLSLAEANRAVAADIQRLRSDLPASAHQLAEYFFPAFFLTAQPAFRDHFTSAPPRSPRSARRAAATVEVPAAGASAITQPTLLIAGELDRVVPARITLAMAESLTDSRCVVLPGVGHLTLAQAPDLVARHVREFFGEDAAVRADAPVARGALG